MGNLRSRTRRDHETRAVQVNHQMEIRKLPAPTSFQVRPYGFVITVVVYHLGLSPEVRVSSFVKGDARSALPPVELVASQGITLLADWCFPQGQRA